MSPSSPAAATIPAKRQALTAGEGVIGGAAAGNAAQREKNPIASGF